MRVHLQFRRVANLYFLLIAVLSATPIRWRPSLYGQLYLDSNQECHNIELKEGARHLDVHTPTYRIHARWSSWRRGCGRVVSHYRWLWCIFTMFRWSTLLVSSLEYCNPFVLHLHLICFLPYSPVHPVTNVGPLVLVLAVSLLKEAFEDRVCPQIKVLFSNCYPF